jgi:iron complex outermembrane receptor protein
VLAAARTRYSGHRDHDRALQTAFLAKLERELAPGTELGLRFSGVWAPEAQDPGALTQEELEADPGASHPSARRFDAGEELHQQQGALTLRHHFTPAREVRGMLYRTERSFENALLFEPRGRVDLDRSVTGGSLVYTDRWRRLGVLVGADADVQADLRSRWDNVNGARGALRLRQSETVRALGPFAELDLDLGGGLGLVGGLRYDWIEFRVGDRHVTPGSVDPEDADQSGAIRYRELSPRIGIRFGRSSSLHAYANFTTSFEVPTTTELSPASGVGGFDRSLEPERAAGLEAGLKGILAERLVYDLAGFTLRVHDALVPFEDSSGRTFFRNSGRVDRHGLEAGLSAVLHPWAQLRLAYTWIDARYHDFDVLDGGVWIEHDGNREPNIPRHNLTAELRFDHPSGIFAVLALHSRSSLPLDDANTEKEDAVTFSDLRAGYEWPRGRLLFRPFVGVRNWTDELYAGTIRPNAAFRRYVEPAPGIQAYAGVSVELGP